MPTVASLPPSFMTIWSSAPIPLSVTLMDALVEPASKMKDSAETVYAVPFAAEPEKTAGTVIEDSKALSMTAVTSTEPPMLTE